MPGTDFEIRYRDGLARVGKFTTPHGVVTTPTLLPVINPSNIPVSVETMKQIGAEMVITNSYIIHKSEDLREKALKEGVHSIVGDIPIMTDSGTFQMYVYGKVEVTNEQIIEFQRNIGTDVGTILDVFTLPKASMEKAREEAEETLRRAEFGASIKGDMALAGTVQGGVYPELREWHARELSRLELDLHPIGGVVPLMENARYRTLAEIILGAKKGLIPSRPVHLFGAGHPMIFPLAAYLGCDLFDSSSYIKYAKDERMMFQDGTRRLKDIHELSCPCPICTSTSIQELRSMPEEERIERLSLHNLYVSFCEIRRIRDAIKYGDLREIVEARLRVNPHLLSVFEVLRKERNYIERFEPVFRRSAFYFTGPESLDRPNVQRYLNRFYARFMESRKDHPQVIIVLEEGEKPYSRAYRSIIQAVEEKRGRKASEFRTTCKVVKAADARFFVNSIFGPVPLELDEMYPIAQTVIPDKLDPVTMEMMRQRMEDFSRTLPLGRVIIWEGEETLEALRMCEAREPKDRSGKERGIERVKAVADMQFGEGARVIFEGEVRIVRSRRTGKIRNVYVDGEHIVSMRAHDGLFTLKLQGAKKLMRLFPSPGLRVMVNRDAAEFCVQGKNVFARFVLEMDEELRPMDEAIVVDEHDALIAIGRVILVREEALAFDRGIAVKVREGSRRQNI
ncbi:MAG: tRNA guanosine(15) transglycosylase TgtA [Thermoplasmata archaeon]|nr:tRNA guanosine(15) transglycosylase TgtA [Thermoplasmata archaeon]